MSDFIIRHGEAADIPDLKALWSRVFGDSDAEIDDFFNTFFDSSICLAAESDSALAAMGFLLPVGYLRVPGNIDTPCGMIYAIATEPAKRKLGCGSAVTRELIDAAKASGIDAVVLHPAEESLFSYYKNRTELKTAFFCSEERISVEPRNGSTLIELSAAEYMDVRAEILKGMPFITFDERCFEYQKRLCGSGGLFMLDGASCCAAVEVTDNNVRIIELLGDGEPLLGAIAGAYPAGEYHVRRQGTGTRFGMIKKGFSMQNGWFGLAFD